MFPKKLFTSPDDWGDQWTQGRNEMEKSIAALMELGEEWENISIHDCELWELVEVCGDKAIYEAGHSRTPCYVIFKHGTTDTFTWVHGVDNDLEWMRELATAE